MTLEDARDRTASAIAHACEQLLPGAITALSPAELAARWGGAPATLAGRIGMHHRQALNYALRALRAGLSVTDYDDLRNPRAFIVRRTDVRRAPRRKPGPVRGRRE